MTYRSIEIEKGVPRYAAVNQNTNTNTNIIYISYTSSNFILIANLINGSIEVKIPVNSHGNIVVNDVTNRVYISSSD
jgi:DNA-binding beta-propeller fold protein YncE